MIRSIFTTLFGAASFAGLLGLFAGFQLRQMQLAAQLEPQTISLAELIKNGAGDNAHVTLSDFTFGKPLIEKASKAGSWAWVPMFDKAQSARHPAPPMAVFRVFVDEAGLAEFLKSSSVTAVVSNQMPSGSGWTAHLPGRFAIDYPGMKLSKALVLTNPEITFAGATLSAARLFNTATQSFAWTIGGVLAAMGLSGLLWMGRSRSAAAPPAAHADHSDQLAAEEALSSHEFNARDFASRGFKVFLYCGILLALLGLIFVAGASLLARKPESGLTIMGISAALMLINALLIWHHWRYRKHGVARIDVCEHGLRWVKAGESAARLTAWSQIASLHLQHVSPYPWRHSLVLAMHSGDTLHLAAFSLTNYPIFAKGIVEGRAGRTQAFVASPVAAYEKLSAVCR